MMVFNDTKMSEEMSSQSSYEEEEEILENNLGMLSTGKLLQTTYPDGAKGQLKYQG